MRKLAGRGFTRCWLSVSRRPPNSRSMLCPMTLTHAANSSRTPPWPPRGCLIANGGRPALVFVRCPHPWRCSGAEGDRKMRPTTTPFSTTSYWSSRHCQRRRKVAVSLRISGDIWAAGRCLYAPPQLPRPPEARPACDIPRLVQGPQH
jgi:hypothetical protein